MSENEKRELQWLIDSVTSEYVQKYDVRQLGEWVWEHDSHGFWDGFGFKVETHDCNLYVMPVYDTEDLNTCYDFELRTEKDYTAERERYMARRDKIEQL